MRNAPKPRSGTWSAFVLRARTQAHMSQQGLADTLGVNKTTIWRWENEDRRPEAPELALKLAIATNQPATAALKAAGFVVELEQLEEDPRLDGLDPNDPVVQRILDAPVDDEMREMMLDRRRQQLAQRVQQDLAEIDFWAKRDKGAA